MTEKRSTSLHYETELQRLENYMRSELDYLRVFDAQQDDQYASKRFEPKSYFSTIKAWAENDVFDSAEAFQDICNKLSKYVPDMMDALQGLGDEHDAFRMYGLWLNLLTDNETHKVSDSHLCAVINRHGGEFIRDMRFRYQYTPSWEAFNYSISVLHQQIDGDSEKSLQENVASDVTHFILEHGTTSLALCASETSDGLVDKNESDYMYVNEDEYLRSYADSAVETYETVLKLLNQNGSSQQVKDFVHTTYPVLRDILSNAKCGKYEVLEKKIHRYADSRSQYSCTLWSLNALKKQASHDEFYGAVHEYVPDAMDQFRKNGHGRFCLSLAKDIIELLQDNQDQCIGFIETICTREVRDLIKKNFVADGAALLQSMKENLNISQCAALILADPGTTSNPLQPVAVIIGYQDEHRQDQADQDFMLAFNENKTLVLSENPQFYYLQSHADQATLDRASKTRDEGTRVPMYLGAGMAYSKYKHLYVYHP